MNTVQFYNENCSIKFATYPNGRTAIQLLCEDGSPMATATVNLPEVPVSTGNVLIKNYSENTGMLDALIQAGIIGQPIRQWNNGFADFPECPLLIKH